MKRIEEEQEMQDTRIKNLEGKIDIINDKEFTIMGYANMNDISINNRAANYLGRKASKLSRERGYYIGKVKHPVYGRVNTYHVDVLETIFNYYLKE